MVRWLVRAVILCVFFQFGCKENPVEPIKNPRTYTWTIDTLAYPGSFQTNMREIWGSSPENVYVVGHNDQNRGLMWHFDGKQWTDVKLSTTQGGTISGAIDLYSIFGFNASNIFAIGERIYDNPTPPPNFLDSSLIIQYDGRQWREHRVTGAYLLSIWGINPTSMWACGWRRTLFHYDGQSWKQESVPVSPPPGTSLTLYSVTGTSTDNVYLLGSAHENAVVRTTYYFLRRNAGGWALIDTFVNQPGMHQDKWGEDELWASPWGKLYSVGSKGVYRLDGSSWTKILTTNEYCTKIFGTSENNIFVTAYRSILFHYDGVDWYQYENLKFPTVGFSSGWTDGKDIFIVGSTYGGIYPEKTIILRGK